MINSYNIEESINNYELSRTVKDSDLCKTLTENEKEKLKLRSVFFKVLAVKLKLQHNEVLLPV